MHDLSEDLILHPQSDFIPIPLNQERVIMRPLELPPPRLPFRTQLPQRLHLRRRDQLVPRARQE